MDELDELQQPYIDAIKANDAAMVRSMLARSPPLLELRTGYYDFDLPFFVALRSGSMESAQAMVECGLDVETRDAVGFTLLMLAASNEPRLAEWLLRRGADPKARSFDGVSLLACSALHPESLKMVVDRFGLADLEREARGGSTPLLTVLGWGDERGARALLALGADARALSWEGGGAVARSAKCRSIALLSDLVEAGADPLRRSFKGHDALVSYAGQGLAEACRMLLEMGARPDGVCGEGRGPLLHSLLARKPELAEDLVKAGASLDAVDGEGDSIYCVLRDRDMTDMVKLLGHLERVAEGAKILGALANKAPKTKPKRGL